MRRPFPALPAGPAAGQTLFQQAKQTTGPWVATSGPNFALTPRRTGITGDNVKVISREKFKVLAKANGWSHDYARGYVDGEAFRRQGRQPTSYALVGIDEYSLGFRAGYYERQDALPVQLSHSDMPAAGG
jgi:hypothetical protein